MQKLDEVLYLNLPTIEDKRGCLSIIEQCKHIPFLINGVRWYSLDKESVDFRLFAKCDLCLVALSGRIGLTVSDHISKINYELDSSSTALYVPNGILVDISCFSGDAILLILTSNSF